MDIIQCGQCFWWEVDMSQCGDCHRDPPTEPGVYPRTHKNDYCSGFKEDPEFVDPDFEVEEAAP